MQHEDPSYKAAHHQLHSIVAHKLYISHTNTNIKAAMAADNDLANASDFVATPGEQLVATFAHQLKGNREDIGFSLDVRFATLHQRLSDTVKKVSKRRHSTNTSLIPDDVAAHFTTLPTEQAYEQAMTRHPNCVAFMLSRDLCPHRQNWTLGAPLIPIIFGRGFMPCGAKRGAGESSPFCAVQFGVMADFQRYNVQYPSWRRNILFPLVDGKPVFRRLYDLRPLTAEEEGSIDDIFKADSVDDATEVADLCIQQHDEQALAEEEIYNADEVEGDQPDNHAEDGAAHDHSSAATPPAGHNAKRKRRDDDNAAEAAKPKDALPPKRKKAEA